MRLIDADAFLDFLRIEEKIMEDEEVTFDYVRSLIVSAPTIEAKPIVHAHWFLLDDCANEGVYCSACRKKVYRVNYANPKLVESKFCPNCGAQMDEKESD